MIPAPGPQTVFLTFGEGRGGEFFFVCGGGFLNLLRKLCFRLLAATSDPGTQATLGYFRGRPMSAGAGVCFRDGLGFFCDQSKKIRDCFFLIRDFLFFYCLPLFKGKPVNSGFF